MLLRKVRGVLIFKKIHLFIFGSAGSLSGHGFFLVVVSGGYCLVPTCGLLFVVASLPVERGLWVPGHRQWQQVGSGVVVPGL